MAQAFIPSDTASVSTPTSTGDAPASEEPLTAVPLMENVTADVIMDPMAVLDLINSGDLIVEGEIDSSQFVDPVLNQPALDTVANWNQEIEAMFLPPTVSSDVKKSSPRVRKGPVTSHRLLTSLDIIAEKEKLEERKREKKC